MLHDAYCCTYGTEQTVLHINAVLLPAAGCKNRTIYQGVTEGSGRFAADDAHLIRPSLRARNRPETMQRPHLTTACFVWHCTCKDEATLVVVQEHIRRLVSLRRHRLLLPDTSKRQRGHHCSPCCVHLADTREGPPALCVGRRLHALPPLSQADMLPSNDDAARVHAARACTRKVDTKENQKQHALAAALLVGRRAHWMRPRQRPSRRQHRGRVCK